MDEEPLFWPSASRFRAAAEQAERKVQLLSLCPPAGAPTPAEILARASLRAGAGACWIDAEADDEAAERVERAGRDRFGSERSLFARAGSRAGSGLRLSRRPRMGTGAICEMVIGASSWDALGAEDRPLSIAWAMAASMAAACAAEGAGQWASLDDILGCMSEDAIERAAFDPRSPRHLALSAQACLRQAPGSGERLLAPLRAPIEAMLDLLGGWLSDDASALGWDRLGAPREESIVIRLGGAGPRGGLVATMLGEVAHSRSYETFFDEPWGPGPRPALCLRGAAPPRCWSGLPCATRGYVSRVAFESSSVEALAESPDLLGWLGERSNAWALGPRALAHPALAEGSPFAASPGNAERLPGLRAELRARSERADLELGTAPARAGSATRPARRV